MKLCAGRASLSYYYLIFSPIIIITDPRINPYSWLVHESYTSVPDWSTGYNHTSSLASHLLWIFQSGRWPNVSIQKKTPARVAKFGRNSCTIVLPSPCVFFITSHRSTCVVTFTVSFFPSKCHYYNYYYIIIKYFF